ncbi:MAG: hypothetical protein A2725_00770 [Candidatus Magasanikbacteria bacterium RIFCSPHIGHO2_01_FULL_33_34]|uniref:Mechanosensitive ion channel protein MscS n=1 Tax=Candidatus Magasanikbacteria bacterium RIFCSPHIGHO2_01_FULL_33_34 TaxID=1798671 RepID=A0A1F6LIW5_9BACT|nr:MAG: hypothetical protein A2725_00770 [Candidatus Magasanikbacteria bacterium RIFCSPHIGHO2_01_FULL_33_34]OGH65291.1 MAG: hypothetical protein A3B83_04430 [Candidatus Magasanikbacteria bacterium RIFCSPHIGHO2_02_FULL_33_17]OGH76068.1 MAG: hypothetical protein A3A89_01355 [Candidatus Magasanikbacteria bacterium RIFCSPLOWO2_01_FULL_33_34]OGH81761.1 MAG: hypothetical protein A3F93_00805 [Candidatus Magasanikbacteria bacterium RIFCSPLOWO2_12_FULL_34_7]
MIEIIEFLKSISYFGNSLWQFTIAGFILVASMTILMIFQSLVLRKLRSLAEKTVTDVDDVAVGIVSSIKPPLYFMVAVYIGYRFLNFPELADKIVNFVFFVILAFEVIRSFGRLFDYLIDLHTRKLKTEEEKNHVRNMMRILKNFVLLGFGVLAIILILSNYGVNVNSIIASLGIGGLAIALAMQNILTDIFSSFSIFIDKPFQIGDFIIVGTDMGTVQKIGLKTTRIKSLQGEELIISNQELTTARVQNLKRMETRRISFKLGVVYGTSSDKLEKIPKIIREIIDNSKLAKFDRCHFKNYEDSSLSFEIVYFVKSPDYNKYMDTQQEINLAIYKAFETEKIEFAYPTQTLHIQK